VHVQFADDVVDVIAHRVEADEQFGGDLFGGEAVGEAAQHVDLAFGEALGGCRPRPQQFQHPADDAG
jgi:truncated hemoglobin YjbI